ncbi:unnamed protein product [Brachionus calyciflorus]|uniref:Uncharacterized protein n=1 Tax=Brachionus calyciflorus TaxID=104777 RepID=A0A814BIA1_9BILA|nr:unnamed protein product [Brachionus calyciflorus]
MSKSRLNDLPEKDLNHVQQTPNMNSNSHHQRAYSAQATSISNFNSRFQITREHLMNSLPETNRIMSQPNFNPQLSPYMYDRLTSTMNHMSINDKMYNPSTSSIISNQSSESINESIMRRENEIDRLKMRILLLEQQVTPNPAPSSHIKTDPVEIRFKNFEMEAAYLRNQFTSYNNTKFTINELENLLNQREFEIQEMKKNHFEDIQKLDREILHYKNLSNSKEEQLVLERNRINNNSKEIDKLNSKLAECNAYISELPTKDELKQNDDKMSAISKENENLRQKISDYEKRQNKAKQFIREKNIEINDLRDKFEKMELEKEKIYLEFQNYKLETQSVGELIEKCKENANLKAELEIARKFIVNFQEKTKINEQKYETELNELNNFLSEKENAIAQFNEMLNEKENAIVELNKSITNLQREKKSLEAENLNLTDRANSLEAALSADALKLLKALFKELNLTIKDLNLIVTNCIDIYHGNQVDICSLLGTAKQCSSDVIDLNKSDTILSTINVEFLQKNIQNLKDTRKQLDDIKKMITTEYAEKIGNNISCMMQ